MATKKKAKKKKTVKKKTRATKPAPERNQSPVGTGSGVDDDHDENYMATSMDETDEEESGF